MNKPRGYVCSHLRDEPESKIVFDLLPVSKKCSGLKQKHNFHIKTIVGICPTYMEI